MKSIKKEKKRLSVAATTQHAASTRKEEFTEMRSLNTVSQMFLQLSGNCLNCVCNFEGHIFT